ncbi:hypothetical protein RsS62_61270 [Rhizobium dioscoreae]|nr:hypothetical protein RsS62_61270 [Rhizobium dioscoreae]
MLQRKPALHLRFRANEIGEAFHLYQIHLSILECAPRKLAMFRHSAMLEGRELFQKRVHHSFTAVDMKLNAIFARKRGWTRKNQDKAAVYHQTVTSPNRSQRGLPRLRQRTGKGFGNTERLTSADTDHSNAGR